MIKDNRVEIELNLDEHEIYKLAMEAHKMIESILQEVIDKYKTENVNWIEP